MRRGGGSRGYSSERRVSGLRDSRVCVSRTIVIGRTSIIVSVCTSRGVGECAGNGGSGSLRQWALHRGVKPTSAVLKGHIVHAVHQVVRHSTDDREGGPSAEERALALVSSHVSGETLKQEQNEKKM